ncbi:tetratricopeptide repeat protein [Vibrio rotiferianus]|uniref:tetratricopeptide repeat protein n=1 Tax=Vibrio rotiferianus TaxID=190895 RepID=UPI002894B342|nr:putative TPR domain protein, component of TonB system [Vibrio rotiferianus]
MKFNTTLLASLVLVVGAHCAPAFSDTPELSNRTFKTVNKVQELIATEQYSDAIERLNSALESSSKKPYDRAVLLQQKGFLFSLQDNYPKAASYFAKSLELNALPVPIAQQVRYSLAQLYLAESQYSKSINTMKEWFKVAETTEEKPQAHAYITLASAYVQLEDYKNAIPPTKKAIAMTKNPSESWYQLLMSSHYELKQFKSVAGVLKILTTKYPKNKRYWTQLSGIYMELGQERNALSTLEMAHKMGLFDDEKEYVRLVNFQAYKGVPFRAAKTLEEAMEKGYVERSVGNLEKLAEFWQQAQELSSSITVYQQAYNLEPKAKTQIKIARLMILDKQYTEAAKFAKTAAPDAKRDQKGELSYIRGMAYFELKQPMNALKAMKSAAQSPDMKAVVSPWINFLETQG